MHSKPALIIQPFFNPYPCDRRVFVELGMPYCLDTRVGDPCIHPSECKRCVWRMKNTVRDNRKVPQLGSLPCVETEFRKNTATVASLLKTPQKCQSGGVELKTVTNDWCSKCSGRSKLKVFQCNCHGEVTVIPCKSGDTEYFNCENCNDFKCKVPPLPMGVSQDDLQKTVVVIPVVGQQQLTTDLLGDIARELPLSQVLIVDNGGDYQRVGDEVIASPGKNLGWLGANNWAVEMSAVNQRADRLVLLNNDLRLAPGFFAGLIDAEKRYGLSIVAASYDGHWDIQRPASVPPGKELAADKYGVTSQVLPYGSCDGTCVSVRREVFTRVGLFDADAFGQYGWAAMTDLCFRARSKGMTTGVARGAYAHHVGGGRQTAAEVIGRDYVRLAEDEGCRGMERLWGAFWKDERPLPTVEPCTVYTCLTAGRDRLREPAFRPPGWRWVCFTDDPALLAEECGQANGWEIRPLAWKHEDPRRVARWHKTHPDELFSNTTVSIWMDASLRPTTDWRPLLWQLGNRSVMAYKHYERDCIYAEADVCASQGLDSVDVITKQMDRYRAAGYPAHNGLTETTVVVRRHDDKSRMFNHCWWDEIQSGSKRDQLSADFVAWEFGFKIAHVSGDVLRASRWFKRDKQKDRKVVP